MGQLLETLTVDVDWKGPGTGLLDKKLLHPSIHHRGGERLGSLIPACERQVCLGLFCLDKPVFHTLESENPTFLKYKLTLHGMKLHLLHTITAVQKIICSSHYTINSYTSTTTVAYLESNVITSWSVQESEVV